MLTLASASPRRRELLALLTEDFAVVTKDTDETVSGLSPEETVLELARRKALAVHAARPDDLVIGADTVVCVEGTILGKPRDEREAAAMLGRLSGRSHWVYTGVAIARAGGCAAFAEAAEVEFIPLSAADIAGYIATGEPMDKAGAYGIQGKGARFIPRINGDYYTVMGLPVCRLAEVLRREYGVPFK